MHTRTSGRSGRNFTTSYSYDAASNRTGFTDPENGSTSFVYDTLNRLQTLTPPAAISGGSFGFSYDALSRRTQMTRPRRHGSRGTPQPFKQRNLNVGPVICGELATVE